MQLKVKTPLCGGVGFLWLVRDSNPRRLSRLIYSQIPLAAWVTSRRKETNKIAFDALKEYQYLPLAVPPGS